MYKFLKHKNKIAIFLIWLFHISAMIGISIGYKDWFASKTVINLSLITVLFLISLPELNLKTIICLLLVYCLGFIIEVIGVKTGFPFGAYTYGENLGIKLFDVPLLIGANWMVLIFACTAIASLFTNSKWLTIALAALLMILIDFFIEPTAPKFDYWSWAIHHPPLSNFIAWYVIAAILAFIILQFQIQLNKTFSIQVYLVQLVYFIYFYAFPVL